MNKIIDPLLTVSSFSLGYSNKNAQSNYYFSDEPITQDEIVKMSKIMNKNSIGPENTRVRKMIKNDKSMLQLLQASAETESFKNDHDELADDVFLVRKNHSEELIKVCSALKKAKEYADNDKQNQFLTHYIECFRTGSLIVFQESQKMWMTNVSARVENILEFIEPYRDPAEIRSE